VVAQLAHIKPGVGNEKVEDVFSGVDVRFEGLVSTRLSIPLTCIAGCMFPQHANED
jgi:hypothetical protein